MNTAPKLAILEALSEMDNLQAEKVLAYVKSLLETRSRTYADYSRFRQEALKEIRSALRKNREPGLTA